MKDEMVRAILRLTDHPLRKRVTRRTSDVWAKRKVGDLLWVRECWAQGGLAGPDVQYRATSTAPLVESLRWRPGIHMPRWASRLTLRVTDLRREGGASFDGDGNVWPLPAVVDSEARLEGVADRNEYIDLFESINGREYPAFVWRIAFEVVS